MDDPVEIPIEGVLDLHTFAPKEVSSLLPEYLSECRKRGIFQIRIIHGKGRGILRRTVWTLLERDPAVAGLRCGELDEGGWGTTMVLLRH